MKTSLFASFLLWAVPAAALADEVELNDGTRIEGKVTDLGDEIRILKSAGTVTYPKYLVKGIVYSKSLQEQYAEKSAALADGDVVGRLKLARWCLDRKMAAEAAAEYGRIVAVQPDHEAARAALGYRKSGGRWMTEDEINAAEGRVKHEGRWVTPVERDLQRALAENKELDRRIAREVSDLLGQVHSPDEGKRGQAKAALSRIEDARKVRAYLSAVRDLHAETRRFAAEELGRMKEASASRPLARAAIWDKEEAVRAAAVRALRRIDHPDAALHLTPYLGEYSMVARIRCAEALSQYRDPRAAPALLSALGGAIARLRSLEAEGDQGEVLVHSTLTLRNGTQLEVPRVVRLKATLVTPEDLRRFEMEKTALLGALRAATGEDFGEDTADWRAWILKNAKGAGKE